MTLQNGVECFFSRACRGGGGVCSSADAPAAPGSVGPHFVYFISSGVQTYILFMDMSPSMASNIFWVVLFFTFLFSSFLTAPSTPFIISAAPFPAQARLVESAPVPVRVVHRDLCSRLDALRYQHHPLRVQPGESLKLGIRFARVVNKPCVVPLPALPYLILRDRRSSVHHVQVAQIARHQSGELSDRSATVERLDYIVSMRKKGGRERVRKEHDSHSRQAGRYSSRQVCGIPGRVKGFSCHTRTASESSSKS